MLIFHKYLFSLLFITFLFFIFHFPFFLVFCIFEFFLGFSQLLHLRSTARFIHASQSHSFEFRSDHWLFHSLWIASRRSLWVILLFLASLTTLLASSSTTPPWSLLLLFWVAFPPLSFLKQINKLIFGYLQIINFGYLHSLWLVEVPLVDGLLGPHVEALPGQDPHLGLVVDHLNNFEGDDEQQVLGRLLGCLLLLFFPTLCLTCLNL